MRPPRACTGTPPGWRQRQAAARRLPRLPCGHGDPWLCRHDESEVDPDLLATVATHLLTTTGGPGLGHDRDAAQALWRRGGASARLAERIYSMGGVVA